MRLLLYSIFGFIVDKAKVFSLIISIAILLEGILCFFFPKRVKRVVQACPVFLFRILGGLKIIFGIILIFLFLYFLYLEIL